MERLFSPCTRLLDLLESQGRRVSSEELRELNLDVSTGEFLSAERAFTYVDLYSMLGNGETIAWLTPDAVVTRGHGERMPFWGQLGERCFRFDVDGKTINV
jgi:hypothetical protein